MEEVSENCVNVVDAAEAQTNPDGDDDSDQVRCDQVFAYQSGEREEREKKRDRSIRKNKNAEKLNLE